ncbi:MAG: SusD/RagB family nutrient-binding outer membrane lipoprotein [Bacteroidota bacterium]
MKSMNYILSLILLLLAATGCKESFQEVNQNPNAPEQVDAQFLLSNVLWQAANNQMMQGWLGGNFLAQQASNLEFLPIDRYDLGSNTELWNATYRLLNDLQAMQEVAPDNDAYQAVGMIMKAYLGAMLTDLWNDVPFSQAIQAKDGNFTPVYDTQEEIYTGENGVLDLLEKAVPLLKSTADRLEGDIMYGGDLSAWVRFANSLRLRYLIRISGQVEVSSEVSALLASGELIEAADENAAVPYLSSAPNQWFIFNERDGRYSDVRMSARIQTVFDQLDDPRAAAYFKPTLTSVANGNPAYRGLPNGLSRESQNAYNLSDISLLGARFRDMPDGLDAIFIGYPEVQFLLAEATQKGLISGDTKAFYEAGISAAFAQYAVALPVGYFSRGEVSLDSGVALEKILTQKWLALFMQGYEAWIEVRRTGYPVLEVPKDNLNNDVFPVRFRYPESEQAANGANYAQAVSRIGGDSHNSKGWWEQ